MIPKEQAEALNEMKASAGNSPLAYAGLGARRETVMKNETTSQARARWSREREIEHDMDHDFRRVGDRVMPVRYED